MSNENTDDFRPEDEMMEEFPVEEDGFETMDSEATADSEMFAEGETPEFANDEVPMDGESADVVPDGGVADVADAEAEVEKEKPIVYRPPRMDVYTVLLVLSLIFVSLAAAIHFLECPASEYGTVPFKAGSPIVTTPAGP